MHKLKQIALAGIVVTGVFTVSGCTTAGPFVTNISSDGKGNLIVEKNTVHMNAFMGTVSSGESPSTQVIRILPESEVKQK